MNNGKWHIIQLVLFFLVFFSSTAAHGTATCATVPPTVQWDKTFGGANDDRAYSVQQTTDGGFIVAGFTDSFGAGLIDFWLLKIDSDGTKEWSRTYGEFGYEYCNYVQQTLDGGFILAGYNNSQEASGDFWLVKTDSSGNEEWNQTYGGSDTEVPYSVQQTTDGGFIVAGLTGSFEENDQDFWLVKTEPNGNQEWNQTFGGANNDRAHSVQQTTDGGYVVAGEIEPLPNPIELFDILLIKTDPDGNQEWDKTFGGPENDAARSVQQTTDGGFILAGFTGSFGAGDADFWLIKTDSNGNEEWNQTFGGSNNDYAFSVQQTTDGGYILGGITFSFGAGDADFWLIKTDPDGNEEWNQTFGNANDDRAYSVQQTTDGGFIVAGYTNSFGAGNYDFELIKLQHIDTDIDDDGIGDLCDPCPASSEDLCDPNGSASGWIDASVGGVIESDDGSIRIDIDPNDLYESTVISVMKVNTLSQDVDICLAGSPGSCVSQSGKAVAFYEFNPDDLQFANPVTVTFTMQADDIKNNQQCMNLKIYLHQGGNVWEPIPEANCESSYDAVNQVCTKTSSMEVDHFSLYGLITLDIDTGLLGIWGKDDFNQVSDAPSDRANDYTAVSAGYFHSLALKSDGTITGWGRDSEGQTTVPDGNDFVDIAAGYHQSMALKSDGSILVWGSDNDAQISNAPSGNDFSDISSGKAHCLALKNDGSLSGWGEDFYGEVSNIPIGNDFVAISAGYQHNLALKSDGSIVGWGLNNLGQAVPPGGNDFVAIAAGVGNSLALKSNGSIAAWGDDSFGQSSPPGGNDYVAVSAGHEHSLALKSDGTLVSWGRNQAGEGGPVSGDTFVSISAGGFHNMAIYTCPLSITHTDLTNDCYIDLKDLAVFCAQWLDCHNPFDPACAP